MLARLLLARVCEEKTGRTWEDIRQVMHRLQVVTYCGPAGQAQQCTAPTPDRQAILSALGSSSPPRIWAMQPAVPQQQPWSHDPFGPRACYALGLLLFRDLFPLATSQAGVDWLQEQKVDDVAMEATGAYWKPIYNLLEAAGLHPIIGNATQMKGVPGRKTDVGCRRPLRLACRASRSARFGVG